MAKVKLQAGAEFDLLTKGELDDSLQASEQREISRLSGVKKMRMPIVEGVAVSSALTMGGHNGPVIASPAEGYVWYVRHLVIEGLTASSSTPDIVNIKRNDRIIWQLNGNQFCQTWGHGEIVLNPGEALAYASVGTFAATGQIIAHGTVDQVPAQLAGKIA